MNLTEQDLLILDEVTRFYGREMALNHVKQVVTIVPETLLVDVGIEGPVRHEFTAHLRSQGHEVPNSDDLISTWHTVQDVLAWAHHP